MDKWHLSLSSEGRHSLFPTEGIRRAAVHIIVGHAGPWLVAFGIADDHLHVEVACTRVQVGKLARALRLGLGSISGCGFEPTYIEPVDSRSHALTLVSYAIQQPQKHGLPCHPALWSGSCFSDIVGARCIEGLRLRIRDVWPRYRAADAWRAAGLPRAGIPPATDARIFSMGLGALRDAAAFAVCSDPGLGGRTQAVVASRATVVLIGRQAGFRSTDIARTLDIGPEAVRRLRRRQLDERVISATRQRLGIKNAIAETSIGTQSGHSSGP